jgi:hypothetical protein
MTHPSCSLCHRIGINCVYPKDRKRPVRRNTAGTQRPYSTATGERRGQPSSPQHIDNQSRTLSLHAEALLSELLDSSVPEQSVSMSDASCQTTNPPALPALPPLPTSPLINRSSQNQQGVLNRTQNEEPAVIPGVAPRTPADLYFDLSFSGADQDPLSLMNAAFPWMSPMGEQIQFLPQNIRDRRGPLVLGAHRTTKTSRSIEAMNFFRGVSNLVIRSVDSHGSLLAAQRTLRMAQGPTWTIRLCCQLMCLHMSRITCK